MSNAENLNEVKPEPQSAPTPTKRWADEADEEDAAIAAAEEEAESSAGLNEEVPDVAALSITDESRSEFLEEPEDSNIEAVSVE